MPAGEIFKNAGYEQDPRWTAVDDYTLAHLQPSSREYNQHLDYAIKASRDEGLPPISSSPVIAKFLALQCSIGNVKNALEVGTLGGYTSIFIAKLNPDIHITSVEINPKHAEVARQNVTRAGVGDRVEIIVGPGLEVLPQLKRDIEEGRRQPFGFTFIDADKENNWAYFDIAVTMSTSKGCIFVDNIVRSGRLVDEKEFGEVSIKGAREVIEMAGKDNRVEAVAVQTVGEKTYDGFVMAVCK
ncbi:putative O-methyltransferase [Glonium stellatum]|uniref:Putative O-methyltransferase n=1 Tax=Glonium stellatum TaxID=574774 RepID=A0A8E2JVA0_9PEZI|nr:putative O-methyltransferase [Glonium stellatum]